MTNNLFNKSYFKIFIVYICHSKINDNMKKELIDQLFQKFEAACYRHRKY